MHGIYRLQQWGFGDSDGRAGGCPCLVYTHTHSSNDTTVIVVVALAAAVLSAVVEAVVVASG